MKRSDCKGCYNEFYHCSDASFKCWSYDDAELSRGRLQHKDTMPKDFYGDWELIPDCFQYQNGFVERFKTNSDKEIK